MIECNEVVVSAQLGGCQKYPVHSEYVLLDIMPLQELGYRVDARQEIQETYDQGGSLSCAVFDAVEGLAHVEISVDGEG